MQQYFRIPKQAEKMQKFSLKKANSERSKQKKINYKNSKIYYPLPKRDM